METAAQPAIQMGFFDLILASGPMAKLVLLSLVAASLASWGIILSKWRTLKEARLENARFDELFWSGRNIEEIYVKAEEIENSPVAMVFKAGVKELKKFPYSDSQPLDELAIDNIARALARASGEQVTLLEKQVGLLATTASAAPFVGLFGTVWGIMNSFQSIGLAGGANLAVVAPGISEALITTAAGIAAAVPAVIGYNHFANSIKRQAVNIDSFTQDFLNILQRNVLSQAAHRAKTSGGQ
jgi:biopolymer transport protein TolQ